AIALFFKPILMGRYLLSCLPLFVVLVAAGYRRISKSPLAYPVAVMFVVVVGLQNVWYQGKVTTVLAYEDWRGAVRYVIDNSEPEDGVILEPGESRFSYDYYAAHLDGSRQAPVVVYRAWDPLFRIDGEYVYNRPAYLPDAKALDRLPSAHPRLWLIRRTVDTRPEVARSFEALLGSLQPGFRKSGLDHYSAIDVILLGRAKTSADRR
ncbi:MAG TPA: hypothetical protein VIX12_06320, partial [Candidatus Binataceae bacterium]